MLDSIFQIGAALLAAILVGTVLYNWDNIANTVSGWLRKNNLQNSSLMAVWIFFDKLVTGIKRTLFIKTREKGETVIEETTVDSETLKKEDRDVYEELQIRGNASKNVTSEVMSHLH